MRKMINLAYSRGSTIIIAFRVEKLDRVISIFLNHVNEEFGKTAWKH